MKRALAFFTLALAVGCQQGDRPPAYANVSGTVTYNEKPIDKGQITFAVEGRPPTTIDIIDGKFAGQAMSGSNKIMVSAKKKGTAPKLNKDAQTQIKGYQERMQKGTGAFGSPPADYDPSMIEYIPPEWGITSTQVRVVEVGSPNEFRFDIRGK